MNATPSVNNRSTDRFPFTEEEFNARVLRAVTAYWQVRSGQAKRQRRVGKKDAGSRGEVTGGKQLDAFSALLRDLAASAGFRDNEICLGKTELPIPGYYRSQKKWDFAVCRDGRLLAAAEFKSQSGSFGNNFNNRAEEVLGLARDFWVAYREKAFGIVPQPWLGYFFLLEDSIQSHRSVGLFSSRLPPLEKFKDTSYQERYRILCGTLVLERDFTAAALLVSERPERGAAATFSEPLAALSARSFCRSLFSHLLAAAHA